MSLYVCVCVFACVIVLLIPTDVLILLLAGPHTFKHLLEGSTGFLG